MYARSKTSFYISSFLVKIMSIRLFGLGFYEVKVGLPSVSSFASITTKEIWNL